jgi:hypothetical protein
VVTGRRRGIGLGLVALAAAGAAAIGGHRLAQGEAAPAASASWADVAPILGEHCVGCHSVGGIAPFPLQTARQARAMAQSILAATQQGVMPPWPPGPDSPRFAGADRRVLTADEKETIASWVRAGAPLGPGRAAAAGGGSTAPGRRLVLAPRGTYAPRTSSGATDDYHCFLLEPRLARDAYVTSAVIQPDRANLVHHVILFEAAGGDAEAARRLDRASGGRGWTCFGGPGIGMDGSDASDRERLGAPQWIAAWVPGHANNDLPAGTGVLLHAGAAVVMQVHYNLLHGRGRDRSRAVLRLVDAEGANLTALDTVLVPAPVELPCPRGATGRLCSRAAAVAEEERKYGRDASLIPFGLLLLCDKTIADYPQSPSDVSRLTTSCDRGITRPLRIYGVTGHMHLRGVDIKLELDPGTPQARVLLHIPRWKFRWQDAYYLEQPIDAEPGDTIRVTCTYDNSRLNQPVVRGKRLAPRYVLWGEGTTDEMCLGVLQAAARPAG